MAQSVEEIFSGTVKAAVEKAIADAEVKTTGELRVHLENYCPEDVMDRAAHTFEQLKMHETKDRTGVLFYVAVKSKKFAILGDAGINAKVPENFWEEVKTTVLNGFANTDYEGGLVKGIGMAGDKLAEFFPPDEINPNELTNEISVGDD